MSRFATGAVLVSAMVVLAGSPLAGAAGASTGAHVVVQDVSSGSKIVTHQGDRLLLKLTACESCGYRWKITNKPDPQVEPFVRRRASVPECTNPCTGGNALERFVFAAKGAGRTGVTLGYFGPGQDTPSKTLHLRLVVR